MLQTARWTAIIALFAISFLPLYVSNELFFPFITGKGFAFRILVEVALVAYAVLAVIDRRYRPKFSWVLALFGMFVLWMAIANSFGVNPLKAFWSNFERMDGWITLVHLFAFFVVSGSLFAVEKLWRRWWFYFVSVAALVCGYGALQLMGAAEIHQGGVRVDASFGNAIYLAVYLMFSIFAAGWLALRSKGQLRYWLIAFIALAFVILFYTASRGALIGLIAGATVSGALWLILERKELKTSSGTKVVGGLLVAMVVLAGAFFLARDSSFVQGEPTLARLSTVFSLNEELKVRTTIWGIALQGAAEQPVTGWGQEGFNQVFNKYYVPSLFEQETWFDRAHNTYFDWLIAGGYPAIILFVLLLAAAFTALVRAPELSRAERALLIGALAAYAVQALVVFDNLFSYVPLAILLTMAHAASAKPIAVFEKAAEVRNETSVGVLGSAGVVVAVALIWVVNVPGMNAANHLVYAVSPLPQGAQVNLEYFKRALADNSYATQEIREQLVINTAKFTADEKVPEALKREYAELALLEMGKEVARSPNDARLRVQYASAYEAAGDKESSLLELEKAIELSPKKQVLHINRGFKLYELKRLEEAREAFRYAYELDPSFEQVAASAASGYVLTGDLAGAKVLLMEAFGTTTPDNESLFYAYYQAKQWDELVAVARARVANTNGSAESRLRLGQALAASGRFAEARAEITATIAAFPGAREAGQALLNQIPVVR